MNEYPIAGTRADDDVFVNGVGVHIGIPLTENNNDTNNNNQKKKTMDASRVSRGVLRPIIETVHNHVRDAPPAFGFGLPARGRDQTKHTSIPGRYTNHFGCCTPTLARPAGPIECFGQTAIPMRKYNADANQRRMSCSDCNADSEWSGYIS